MYSFQDSTGGESSPNARGVREREMGVTAGVTYVDGCRLALTEPAEVRSRRRLPKTLDKAFFADDGQHTRF